MKSQSLVTWLGDHSRSVAVVLSFALSAWITHTQQLINNDGIIYLRAAELLSHGDWAGAMAAYPWPFYSGLMALISAGSGLELESSAQLLNSLLCALTVFAFIGVVAELGGGRSVRIMAAFVILLYPGFNESRAEIFRDNGYWAFYLLSLWFFIKYVHQPRLGFALAWTGFMLMAILFRVEGAVFLILLPTVILLQRNKAITLRLVEFIQAHSLSLAIALILLGTWFISPDIFSNNAGRLLEPLAWLDYMGQEFALHWQAQTDRLNGAVLNTYSTRHAGSAVIGVLAAILITELYSAIGLVYTLLIIFSLLAGVFWRRSALQSRGILLWMIAINLFVLSAFLMKYFFLTDRYVMPLILLLLLPLPFYLVQLYHTWRVSRMGSSAKNATAAFAGIIVLALAIDGLHSFGISKVHLQEAGHWLGEQVPAGTRLYANEPAPLYYAAQRQVIIPQYGGENLPEFFRGGQWQEFDYFALRVKGVEEERLLKESLPDELHLAQTFSNGKGDRLLVFHKR